MPWYACCLTLDKVKCLQYPLSTASSDKEALFYVCPLKEGDTYASIVKTIPLSVKNSKCIKGIVIICNRPDSKFWSTPYTSDEPLLPLYVVGVEDGRLLLQKVQPQQSPSLKAGSVQPHGSGVQLDKPEAVYIRFMPVSGGKLKLS